MVVINTLNIDNEGKKSQAWGLGGENESGLGVPNVGFTINYYPRLRSATPSPSGGGFRCLRHHLAGGLRRRRPVQGTACP